MAPTIIHKPRTIISIDVLKSLKSYVSEEHQVVIHGVCKTGAEAMFIRIWPSTYLFDQHSSHISELVHFEKISGFPQWTLVPENTEFVFTLLFTGLPNSCTMFDLQEVIPQSNGFHVPTIKRNKTDVYFLDFS